jgi:hypothetical protein
MTVEDPMKRLTMDQVVPRLGEILKDVSSWRLRSRVVARDEHPLAGLYRAIGHWKRRVVFIATLTPAIPMPATGPPELLARKPRPSNTSKPPADAAPGPASVLHL